MNNDSVVWVLLLILKLTLGVSLEIREVRYILWDVLLLGELVSLGV